MANLTIIRRRPLTVRQIATVVEKCKNAILIPSKSSTPTNQIYPPRQKNSKPPLR